MNIRSYVEFLALLAFDKRNNFILDNRNVITEHFVKRRFFKAIRREERNVSSCLMLLSFQSDHFSALELLFPCLNFLIGAKSII